MLPNLPVHYKVLDVAKYLKRDRKTVENLIKRGDLFAADLTPDSKYRTWVITEDAIVAYLRGEKLAPANNKTHISIAQAHKVRNTSFQRFSEMTIDGK